MSKISDRQKGINNRSLLRDYFAVNPDWISGVALSRATGLHVNIIHAHCRNLISQGYLEEKLIWVNYANALNGRDVIHYRRKLTTTVGQLLSKSTLTQNVTVKSRHSR
jgi:hypothetical protein